MRKLLLLAAAVIAVGVVPSVVTTQIARAATGTTVTVTPVRPYQPGDLVWLTTPPRSGDVSTMATGCERVPASGYIRTNVYADSNAHYANFWQWGAASSGQAYNWWVKRSDNSNWASGSSSGGAGQASGGANILYWKVQNKGATPQAWNVCYDVL